MRARLLLALAAAIVIPLSGPFVGELNTALQDALPGQHLRIVLAVVVVPALAGLAAAGWRVREHRLLRFGALAAAVLIGGLYVAVTKPLYTEQFHLTEYGVLTFLFYRVWRPRADVSALLLPIAAAFIVGMADEWFQWFIPSRVGELRDVLINSVGIACGLLFAVGLNPPAGAAWPRDARSVRALGIGVGALIACTAVFIQSVHLGFEIVDTGIGTFRSLYSATELTALSADRAARWRIGVSGQPLISREDHYLTEARFHIEERNDLLEHGDAVSAWRENRILETYYGPVLDLAMATSRWPAEQRADVERRGAADTRPYVSQAHPLTIYVWPRLAYWTTVVMLLGVVAAWTLSRRSTRSTAAAV